MNTQVNQAVVTDAELIDFSRDVFEYYSIRERVTDADQSDIDRIYKAIGKGNHVSRWSIGGMRINMTPLPLRNM